MTGVTSGTFTSEHILYTRTRCLLFCYDTQCAWDSRALVLCHGIASLACRQRGPHVMDEPRWSNDLTLFFDLSSTLAYTQRGGGEGRVFWSGVNHSIKTLKTPLEHVL